MSDKKLMRSQSVSMRYFMQPVYTVGCFSNYEFSFFGFIFLQTYEARIDALQKQVEEQSMTMSMYSSYSPEDFHPEEDIFGNF